MKKITSKFLASFILVSCLIMSTSSFAQDDNPITEKEALSYHSCEVQFASEMFKYGNVYSCVEEPLLDQIVTGLLTAGVSVALMARLKMNHPELFPEGNCKRHNRVDYWSPKMTIYTCSNMKLVDTMIKLGFQSLVGLITGQQPPLPKIKDYINEYNIVENNTFLTEFDFGMITPYFAKAHTRQDKFCVSILTAATSFMPIGCKYIKEPFPKSIFEKFGENESYQGENGCDSIYSCSQQARRFSQAIVPITSPIITCIRDMLVRMVVSKDLCDPSNVNSNTSENLAKALANGIRNGSMINDFQQKMHGFVTSLLTIYVFFFGVKVAIGGNQNMTPAQFINFIIKVLLVTYFSIGINMDKSGVAARFDGMTQLVFPFMLTGVTEIASWFITSSTLNGLCEFPKEIYDTQAPTNMSLWDQIDCRLAYYIGYDGLMQAIMSGSNDPVQNDIPPYVFFLVPSIIMGNVPLAIMIISYPIMIISFVAYSVCLFCSALVYITILGMLAPIFIPMVLFEQTKTYFTNWWQTMVSMILQPAIAITFLSLMFAVYDRAFYGTCQYRSVTVSVLQDDGSAKNYRNFFMSTDKKDYANEKDFYDCKLSLGFFFNNPIGSIFGSAGQQNISWASKTGQHNVTINPRDPSINDSFPTSEKDYLSDPDKPSIEYQEGLISQSPKSFWESLVNLIKNFIICFIVLSVIKNVMESITSFIIGLSGSQIDPTSGISSGAIQNKISGKVNPMIAKTSEAAQKAIKGLMSGKDSDKKEDSGSGKDSDAGGGGSDEK